MRVAALGRTQWLYDSIRSVAAQGHQVVLIGTCVAAPEYTVTPDDFRRLAEELGSAYFCDASINRPEYLDMARKSGADAAISVNWLTIIGSAMRGQFDHGVVNAHPGRLPRFRGNACPNWAILAGEDKVVVTLHRMADALDAGPILLRRECRLLPETYIGDVYAFLGQVIPEMFVELLNGLEAGTIGETPQPEDLSESLRCFPRLPRDGWIDWTRPAEELCRLVRASAEPFAGAYTYLGDDRLRVWRAHSERLPYPHLGVPGQVVERRRATGEIAVLTVDGVLVLEEVETSEGGRRPAYHALTSTRARLGLDVAHQLEGLRTRVADLERELFTLRGRP